jgi:hypothetical protein
MSTGWRSSTNHGGSVSGTTHKTTKGYLRITAGPHRHQYLHRLVAAAMLGRKLHKSEQVHHLDNNKQNCWFTNLYVLGEKDHGWVSAKQAWFVANVVAVRDKREWGILAQSFLAEQCSLVLDNSNKDAPAIAIDLVARQTDASVYTFTPPSSSTNFGEYSPWGITGVMTGVE